MRVRTAVLVWTAALLCGGGAVLLVLTSDHEESPIGVIALALPVGLAFVGGGLIARVRRPENRTGTLMVLTGFAWFLGALGESNSSLVFTLGWAFGSLTAGFLAHLVLAFPSGRLDSRLDRILVSGAYAVVVVGQVAPLLFLRITDDECTGCPDNAFLISANDTVSKTLELAVIAIALVLIVGVVAVLVRRWRSATPPLRRALAPVLISGGATFAVLALQLVAQTVSDTATEVVHWVFLVALLSVPVSFLSGLLRGRLAHRGVGELLTALPETPTAEQRVDVLRRALHDPTLELAFWIPEQEGYVDAGGKPIELPPVSGGRVTTRIDFEDRPVAAFIHDAALLDEPELLESVVAAARLGLQKERLQAELRARLDELERERDFVRDVVNSSPTFFCVLDLDGRIIRFNTTLMEASGQADDETVRGRPFWEVFVADELQDEARRSFEDAPALDRELTLESRSGRRLAVDWSTTPVTDDRGRPRLLLCGLDVTELRQHAEFLSEIGDATPSYLCVLDAEGRIRWDGLNLTLRKMAGYAIDEVLGQAFWEAFAPEDEADGMREIIESVLAGANADEQETHWLTKEGERRVVAWTCSRLPAVGERREVYLVSGTDVTERTKQAEELRRSRDFLSTVSNTVPSLMAVVDGRGCVTEAGVNVAFWRATGFGDADLIGNHLWEAIVPPDERADVERRFAESSSAQAGLEHENRWRTQDGRERIVAWSSTPLASQLGSDWYLIHAVDVTERKRQELELRRERDFGHAVTDATPSLLIVVDRALHIAEGGVNRAAEERFGYREQELVGRDFVDTFIPAAEAANARAWLDQSSGAGRERDSTWVTRDGEVRLIAWSATPLTTGVDSQGFLICGTDVTERHLQEEEIRASRSRIVAAADEERRRLERNLHDGAQQRLVSLSLGLRLVGAKLASDPPVAAELLAQVEQELALALEELRELARGIHPAVLTDRGLEPALQGLAARSPLPVEVEATAERFPGPVEAAAYYVVAEALTNVARYAQASSVRVTIERKDGRAVVEVADDGVGGADPSGGSGLRGLADRVSALDGRLSVESRDGAGTCIRAEIPVR